MKTLDEVIKAMEWCTEPDQSVCSACPYADDDNQCYADDALHYLKVLKIILDPLKGKIISHEITCPQCNSVIAILLPESNEPLTWDALKDLVGKPVWVVEEGYQTWEYWSLVYWIKDDELILLNENGQTTYSKNEQGTVWQAYRKERKCQ